MLTNSTEHDLQGALALDILHEHVTRDILIFQSMLRGSAESKAFEQEYAEFVGARFCVGVANGDPAVRMNATFVSGEVAPGLLPLQYGYDAEGRVVRELTAADAEIVTGVPIPPDWTTFWTSHE